MRRWFRGRNFYYRSKEEISFDELKEMMRSNHNILLLDVRGEAEYKEMHLPGAINIPLYELEQGIRQKKVNKEKTIVVYCKMGIRSRNALVFLKKSGYQNVYSLKGGLDQI